MNGSTPESGEPTGVLGRLRVFPSLVGYQRRWLRGDVFAGLVLACVLVPQGMAYAELAGLPAVAGLYAALAPIVAYAALGSSRQLVVSPESSTSALVAATVIAVAGAGSPRASAIAAGLALLTGVLFVVAALLRLGFIGDLLSGPVFVGYLNGLAVIIIVSQLPKALGFSVNAGTVGAEVGQLVTGLGATNLVSAAIAVGVIAVIAACRRWLPSWPGPLIAVVGAAVVVAVFHLDVALLGPVPQGLPSIGLPDVTWREYLILLPSAAAVAVVSFADTVVESRTFAARNDYLVDPNRDMVGLGAADLAAGVSGAFNVSSSGSRTAVVDAAGGRTQAANLVAALSVALVLVFLTTPLSKLPNPALAAVVIVAAARLIDVGGVLRLWRVRRSEFAVAAVTLVGVLALGILPGIAVAVGLSVVNVLRRAMRPHDAVLGRVPGQGGFHNVARHQRVETVPGLIVFKFEASLFFGNADYFADRVAEVVEDAEGPLRWFVLDLEASPDVDTTAATVLERVIAALTDQGITVALAEPTGYVRELLERYGIVEQVGADHCFPSLRVAIEHYRDEHPEAFDA